MTSRTPILGQSVADLHPRLLLDWLPELNEGLALEQFKSGSNYRGTWTCHACGLEWETSIANRTLRGSNCRRCSKQRTAAKSKGKPVLAKRIETSLGFRYPEVARFWHPAKNSLNPYQVGATSTLKFCWLCERGHESYLNVLSKVVGFQKLGHFPCKECYLEDKRKPSPGKSLAERYPTVAAQWHPVRNGDLTPADVYAHANTHAWWLCPVGHETYALINSKAQGFDCDGCSKHISKIERDIRLTFALQLRGFILNPKTKVDLAWRKQHTARVDILGQFECKLVVIEYDGQYYHEREEVKERDLAKTEALLAAGYHVVRIRERNLAHLDIKHPNLLQLSFHFKRSAQKKDASALVPQVADWLRAKR